MPKQALALAKAQLEEKLYTAERNRYVRFLSDQLKNTRTNSQKFLEINSELTRLYSEEIAQFDLLEEAYNN